MFITDSSAPKGTIVVGADSFNHPQRKISYLSLLDSVVDLSAEEEKVVLEADSFDHQETMCYLSQMDSLRMDPSASKRTIEVGANSFNQPQIKISYLSLMDSVVDLSAEEEKMVLEADSFDHQKKICHFSQMDSLRKDPRSRCNMNGVGTDSFEHCQQERNCPPLMDSIGIDPYVQKGKMVVGADYNFDRRQSETNQLLLMSSEKIGADPFQRGKLVLIADPFDHLQTRTNFYPENSNLEGEKSAVYPSRVVPAEKVNVCPHQPSSGQDIDQIRHEFEKIKEYYRRKDEAFEQERLQHQQQIQKYQLIINQGLGSLMESVGAGLGCVAPNFQGQGSTIPQLPQSFIGLMSEEMPIPGMQMPRNNHFPATSSQQPQYVQSRPNPIYSDLHDL